jgi:hypothetical protein
VVDASAIGLSFTPVTAHVEPGRRRYFLDAIGERNPVYRQTEAAKAAGYSAPPIPPTYLFCLEMMDADKPFEALEALNIDLAAAEPIRIFAKRDAEAGREVFRKVVNISSIAGGSTATPDRRAIPRPRRR